MNMKFYMTPGSCSTGIHILLEELGLVFEAHLVNLLAGDNLQPDYLALNPKGTIPTLVTPEGQALTDFQSIAWWLACTYPKHSLLPTDLLAQSQVLATLNYVVGTLHGQGFARIFTTDKFALRPSDHEAVVARGREIVRQGFAVLEKQLEGQDFMVGEHFGIADAAVFYVSFWADRTGLDLPPHCAAHYRRLLQRPAVRLVLQEEGYASTLHQN